MRGTVFLDLWQMHCPCSTFTLQTFYYSSLANTSGTLRGMLYVKKNKKSWQPHEKETSYAPAASRLPSMHPLSKGNLAWNSGMLNGLYRSWITRKHVGSSAKGVFLLCVSVDKLKHCHLNRQYWYSPKWSKIRFDAQTSLFYLFWEKQIDFCSADSYTINNDENLFHFHPVQS